MFFVVLSLCLASSLAVPSIGYSYSGYAPLSHSYASYALKTAAYPYSPALAYTAPLPFAPHLAPILSGYETAGLASQYHTEDVHGQVSYGHSEPSQGHHATQDAAGNKIGSFSYVKPDGHVHRTDYVADAAGYRVASNDLPIGPAAPAPTLPHLAAHSLYKRSIYSYGGPVVTPSGHLADTPEVAAAKSAHLAEHAKRGNYHVAPYTHSYSSYTPYTAPYSVSSYYTPNSYSYTPYSHATPVVTPSGYLADTPEVAAAKAAHFAEKAKVSSHYNAIPVPSPYNAIPVSHGAAYTYVTPSGHVADTPEVAAAKAAHFAEHAVVNARNAHASATYPEYAPVSSPHYYAPAPVITPSGHLADTPEVAHAKAAHLAEYAAVASRQKRSLFLGHSPASTVPLGQPLVPYVAAPLPHVLLPQPHLKHTSIIHGAHAVSYRID